MPGYSAPGAFVPQFWTVGSHDRMSFRSGGISTLATNTAWVANLAVYVPFFLSVPATILEWWIYNGTLTTAHSIDYGVYNEDFTKVYSTGSLTGVTTASTIVNTSGTTDTALAVGSYYMGFSTSSTRNYTTSADAVGLYQSWGVMEQTTAFALPSPAVPVAYTRAFLPYFGMNFRSTAV